MKTRNLVGLLAAMLLPWQSIIDAQPAPTDTVAGVPQEVQSSAAVPNDLSPATAEVVRLSESGVGDEVISSYIANSKGTFGLTADHILYLKDLGVAPETITAMLNHDKGLPPTSIATAPTVPEAPTVPQAQTVPSAPQWTTTQPAQTAPLVPSGPPAYVSNPPVDVNYFYSDLAPYGTWISLEGYGWCWQPRAVVINRGWRPYCDGGHWLYTDAGWYWQSDYSWGWAPFHYGRWYLDARCGWVWLPDRVWGPGWVVWRTYGDNCGWAPVPPHATFDVHFGWRFNGVSVGVNFDFGLRPDHFTFIAVRDFNHRDYGRYRVPRTEVTKIYNRTTIINNYTVVNNTIVNHGIAVDRVASATHTEIRKAKIRDVPAGAGHMVATRTADRNAVVYRPELHAPARPVKAQAQKIDDRHPVVKHNDIAVAPIPRTPTREGYRPVQPAISPRDARPSTPQTYRAPQPSSERSTAPRERKTETRTAPSAVSAPVTPPATRSSEPALRSVPDQPRSSIPPGQARGADARARQPDTRGQNAQVYYPKTYYQSREIKKLPPESSRGSGRDTSNSSRSRNKRDQ